MRLFFAFSVPKHECLAIDHWRDKMFAPSSGKIPSQNFHITLSFLGALSPSQLDRLCSETDELLTRKVFCASNINIDQYAYWPKPGIAWIGPSTWPKQVDLIQQQLAQLAKRLHLRQSKQSFQPHISLFRSKMPPSAPLLQPAFSIPCDTIVLYESIQKRVGTEYHEIESWPLKSLSEQSSSLARRPVARRHQI